MPVPIGNFISNNVYDGRLKTVHRINSDACCRLVNVQKGKEAQKGFSWIVRPSIVHCYMTLSDFKKHQNVEEAKTVIQLARTYNAQGKSYRIITPYDAQRSLLESNLKTSGIPWENRVFNVDSFQGTQLIDQSDSANRADYF